MATDPSVKVCITAAVDRMLEALELAAPTPVEPQPWTITRAGLVVFHDAPSSTRIQQDSPLFFKTAGSHNAGVMRSGGMP